MTNILILGAGFGGIGTALELEKKLKNNQPAGGDYKITLVDRNNFHLFTPSLYEVATVYGLIEDSFAQYLRGSVAVPIGEIVKNKKINFIQAEIKEINLKEKYVSTNGGIKTDFDYLVIALGGETEFYGIPGVQDYAFNFKTIDDAIGVYRKILEVYKNYSVGEKNRNIQIAIIGGGFTGVELAAELACCVSKIVGDYKLPRTCTTIHLFEAGPTILPAVNGKTRKTIEKRLRDEIVQIQTNSVVEEIGPDYIKIKGGLEPDGHAHLGGPASAEASADAKALADRSAGRVLEKIDLIIWAGGIKGSSLIQNLGLKFTKKNTIEVNEFLQTYNGDGSLNENIFAVGDNAAFIDPETQKTVPAMAYTAYDQAVVAAENIVNHSHNTKLMSYKPFYDAWIAPASGKWAYFHYKGFNTSGFLGYLLRQIVDLRHFMRILPLRRALTLFFKDLVIFTKND